MFGDAPDGVRLTQADYDRMERCRASLEQRALAFAAMTEDPRVLAVVVPIAFPGKQRGVWHVGQVVEHPEGFEVVRDLYDGYRAAREVAEAAARAHLGDRPGVPGHVAIWNDRAESVFEGF